MELSHEEALSLLQHYVNKCAQIEFELSATQLRLAASGGDKDATNTSEDLA